MPLALEALTVCASTGRPHHQVPCSAAASGLHCRQFLKGRHTAASQVSQHTASRWQRLGYVNNDSRIYTQTQTHMHTKLCVPTSWQSFWSGCECEVFRTHTQKLVNNATRNLIMPTYAHGTPPCVIIHDQHVMLGVTTATFPARHQ